MQALTILSFVLLYAVGVYGVAQRASLFTVVPVIVTSTFLNNASVTNTIIDTQTQNYNGAGADIFTAIFNTTYTGLVNADIGAFLSFSGAGRLYQAASAFCSSTPVYLTVVDYPALQLFQFKISRALSFTAVGSYSASLTIVIGGRSYPNQATLAFSVTAAFTIPAQPTITKFALPASQSTPPNVTLEVTATGNPDSAIVYFSPVSGSQGVVWYGTAELTGGKYYNLLDDLEAVVGSFCDGQFSPTGVLSISGVDFQTDAPVSVQSIELLNGGTTLAVVSGSTLTGNTQFTATNGDDDHVVPACTVAALTPTAITTGNVQATVTTTVGCTDASGIKSSGVFLRFTTTTEPIFSYDFPTYALSNVLSYPAYVPLHASGTLEVIGVWAIDGAGNAVLYGDCGSAGDTLQTICGGGSSAAGALSVSLFALVMCAFMVFFA